MLTPSRFSGNPQATLRIKITISLAGKTRICHPRHFKVNVAPERNDDRSIDNGLCLCISRIQEHVTVAKKKSIVQFTQPSSFFTKLIVEPNKKTSKCGDVLHRGSSFRSFLSMLLIVAMFLCGLHEVYSHIMASSDLFVCPRESSACHVIWGRRHFGCKLGL